jgi:ketosteroid isomerase-like protein
VDDMSSMPVDFDPVAVVVDWLDACRKRDLAALLDLYAEDASIECACHGRAVVHGRTALAAYWQPRLETMVPTAFGLEEITPGPDGVLLDYLSFEGKPVRISFAFSVAGKILQTICHPGTAASAQ